MTTKLIIVVLAGIAFPAVLGLMGDDSFRNGDSIYERIECEGTHRDETTGKCYCIAVGGEITDVKKDCTPSRKRQMPLIPRPTPTCLEYTREDDGLCYCILSATGSVVRDEIECPPIRRRRSPPIPRPNPACVSHHRAEDGQCYCVDIDGNVTEEIIRCL